MRLFANDIKMFTYETKIAHQLSPGPCPLDDTNVS